MNGGSCREGVGVVDSRSAFSECQRELRCDLYLLHFQANQVVFNSKGIVYNK
jgi:hypothetical protein